MTAIVTTFISERIRIRMHHVSAKIQNGPFDEGKGQYLSYWRPYTFSNTLCIRDEHSLR